MKQLLFGISYFIQYWLSKNPKPIICGLVLHNNCNLRCRHCTIVDRPEAKMSYSETVRVIDEFYEEGGRCLYLEGGEPFIWHDEEHRMEDIVMYAKQKGYLAVIIYTNGTRPIETKADTVFVSIDGLRETHDRLRGKSYDRIINNVRSSHHRAIFVNYTINSLNCQEIEDFCSYVSNIPQIRGTFFYFHTPYYGYDELFLDPDWKKLIIKSLLELKKSYHILNSTSGLRSAIRNDWKKKLEICRIYEGGKYYSCCRENRNGSVCHDCGYLSYAEIDQALKLKSGALWNALKYF
ncbi:MAG: radical SAM protein [bacterium]